jgi:hypothetical protein
MPSRLNPHIFGGAEGRPHVPRESHGYPIRVRGQVERDQLRKGVIAVQAIFHRQ